jgi:hypothetical protein
MVRMLYSVEIQEASSTGWKGVEDAVAFFSDEVAEFGRCRCVVRGCFEENGLDEFVADVERLVGSKFAGIECEDELSIYTRRERE